MIDVLGSISLTALFALFSAALIAASSVSSTTRVRLAGVALGWLGLIGFLAALGVFSAAGVGTVAVGIAVLTPVVLGIVFFRRSAAFSRAVVGLPLTLLIGVHAGRMLGVFFLELHASGRLPPTFALTAGWGDIGIAALTLPLAWAAHHRVAGWRGLALVWNIVGLLDLVTAVTLGVGSAPNSPARFIFESPNSGAIASLPWVMIPGLLVPLYLLSHLAIFAKLARGAVEVRPDPFELPLAGPVPVLADSRNRGRPVSRRTYRGSHS